MQGLPLNRLASNELKIVSDSHANEEKYSSWPILRNEISETGQTESGLLRQTSEIMNKSIKRKKDKRKSGLYILKSVFSGLADFAERLRDTSLKDQRSGLFRSN